MTLKSTQPLTEITNRNLSGGNVRPARNADIIIAICEPTVYKLRNLMGLHGLLQDYIYLLRNKLCLI
jgi:hypothetical protein